MKLMKYLMIITIVVFATISAKSAIIEQEVSFNNGEVKLGGTLTLPDTINKYPAIVMVTGSGQQNRDEEIFGFKIFKIIAEYLTENGYAVLRYDDRGIGKSKNKKKYLDSATTYDFALDALAGLKFLQQHNNIIKNKIGVFGHSEGGEIASILAAENPKDIAFIVMMAGPAISGSTTINSQIEKLNREAGISDAGIAVVLESQNMIYKAIKENYSKEQILSILTESNLRMLDYLPEDKKSAITDRQLYAKSQAEFSVRQVMSPWFRYFVTHNPAEDLNLVKCPIFAIYGSKDIQVSASLNVPVIEKVFESKKGLLTIDVIENANHLFQKAETGNPSEYNSLDKKFIDGFLEKILVWLNKTVNKK